MTPTSRFSDVNPEAGMQEASRTHDADSIRPPWRRPGADHRSAGKRLLDAFEALEDFPAFAPARSLVIERGGAGGLAGDAVAAVESDVALTVAVLRRANGGAGARERV